MFIETLFSSLALYLGYLSARDNQHITRVAIVLSFLGVYLMWVISSIIFHFDTLIEELANIYNWLTPTIYLSVYFISYFVFIKFWFPRKKTNKQH